MTPYQAVYGREPSFGLSHFSVPSEFWNELKNEEELFNFISEVNTTNTHSMEPESESQFIGDNESQENYSPLSKFPPLSIVDDYESQISLPPPTGTIIVDQNANNYLSPNYLQTKDAKDYPHEPCSYYPEHSVIAQNNASTNRTSSFAPATFTNIISTTCLGFNSSTF